MSAINSIKLNKSNNNIIIQEVAENGQVVFNTINWDDLVQKYTAELQKQIDELRKLLERSEKVFDIERLELSGKINKLEKEKEEKEEQIKNILGQYENKNIAEESTAYQKAFTYFIEGNLDAALGVLEDARLEEKEKQQAESRILKGDIYVLKYDFINAEKNYLRASEIFSSFENLFKVAFFYYNQNNFSKAQLYYNKCLGLVDDIEQRSIILNSLGNLQNIQNDYKGAERSYQEALMIRRKLAAVNPDAYLPYVATSLNNLGLLQSDLNDHKGAEKSFQEALIIRRKLAAVNPDAYTPDLVRTLFGLYLCYIKLKNNTASRLSIIDEIVTLLIPRQHLIFAQKYLTIAFDILQGLGINIDDYLKEKNIVLQFKYPPSEGEGNNLMENQ